MLGLPIGDPHHRRTLGHPPNQVERGLSGVETLRSMWESQLGYVLVALPGGGPVGICTRRDVLRACVRRFADLERLPLTQLMSRRVKTVSDTDTLCGLFKRMALESCRHMPVVDAQDRARVVISMWEGVSLVAGA